MIRTRVGLVFAVLACMALWGCAQSPSPGAAANAAKAALEQENRQLTALRDQLREDLQAAVDAQQLLQTEIRGLQKGHEELRQQLTLRTGERDAAISQIEQIRKGIRALMEQTEAAATSLSQPANTAETKPTGQS